MSLSGSGGIQIRRQAGGIYTVSDRRGVTPILFSINGADPTADPVYPAGEIPTITSAKMLGNQLIFYIETECLYVEIPTSSGGP